MSSDLEGYGILSPFDSLDREEGEAADCLRLEFLCREILLVVEDGNEMMALMAKPSGSVSFRTPEFFSRIRVSSSECRLSDRDLVHVLTRRMGDATKLLLSEMKDATGTDLPRNHSGLRVGRFSPSKEDGYWSELVIRAERGQPMKAVGIRDERRKVR